jgi:excisionase family DNA binding protein
METSSGLKSYTIKDVSALLQLTPRTVYQYVKAGKLKGYKLPSGWRFKEKDIQAFITLYEARATRYVK